MSFMSFSLKETSRIQGKMKNCNKSEEARLFFLHTVSWWLLAAGVVAIGLIIGAMGCYAERYEFFGDYLSAMGRYRIHNGEVDNLSACLVFNSGLVISGISCGGYFVLRGLYARKLLGIPMIFLGGIGGLLLLTTGLIPFDIWPDGHNYSIYASAHMLSVSLLLCGIQGNSVFSSRENNISWLVMTLFVGCCWMAIQCLIDYKMISHGGVLQQKLMVFFLWCFMFRNAILLIARTRQENNKEATKIDEGGLCR